MRRLVILCTTFSALLVIAACAEADDDDFSAPQEPSEFAAHAVDLAMSGEWEDLQELMIEEFSDFETETIESTIGIDVFPEHATEPESWQIEEHDAFTTARLEDPAGAAIVLRPENDAWRYDPGPHQQLQLSMQEEGLTSEGQVVPWQVNVASEDDVLANRLFNVTVDHVSVDDGLQVTLQAMPDAAESIGIDNVYWLVNGEETSADITWTTAAITNDAQLAFPQVGGGIVYHMTFHIEDVPNVDAVELIMEDITATGVEGDPEDTFEMDVRFEIPVEEYPELVEAE